MKKIFLILLSIVFFSTPFDVALSQGGSSADGSGGTIPSETPASSDSGGAAVTPTGTATTSAAEIGTPHVDEIKPLPASTTLPLISQPPAPPRPKSTETATTTPVQEDPPLLRPSGDTPASPASSGGFSSLLIVATLVATVLGSLGFFAMLRTKKKSPKKKDNPCGHIKEQLEQKKVEFAGAAHQVSLKEALIEKLKEKIEEKVNEKKGEVLAHAKEVAKDVVLGKEGETSARKAIDTAEELKGTYDELKAKYEQAKDMLEGLRGAKNQLEREVKALQVSYSACMAGAATPSVIAQSEGVKIPDIPIEGGMVLRSLKKEDVSPLSGFLEKLSEQTRKFFNYVSYDRAQAQELCDAIGRYDKERFVLENKEKEIVAIFEFSLGIPETDTKRFLKYDITLGENDCRLGPCIADEYQSKGVGSIVFPQLVEIAKRLGKNRIILWGGVHADNERAIRFYAKNGFRNLGTFVNDRGEESIDMILDIAHS